MRPDSPQWIAAKAEGDRAELAIAGWFRRRGWQTYKTLGQADFDLLLQCEVEVKNNPKALETGNVAIETAYQGNPSGIMTSQATWWVVVVGPEATILKTEVLQRFVLTGKFREVRAGDNMASTVRLVPWEKLKALRGAHVITLRETPPK
jgi:hypothetical protein